MRAIYRDSNGRVQAVLTENMHGLQALFKLPCESNIAKVVEEVQVVHTPDGGAYVTSRTYRKK